MEGHTLKPPKAERPACATKLLPSGLLRDWAAVTPAVSAEAVRILERTGYDGLLETRYLAAAADHTCYLCHLHLSNYLPDCPCPHGLLGPIRTISQAAELFSIFRLTDLLHFLLLHNTVQGSCRLLALRTCGEHVQLSIRTPTRIWVLEVAPRAEAALASIHMYHPRSRKTSSLELAATPQDRTVFGALALIPLSVHGLPICSGTAEDLPYPPMHAMALAEPRP